MPKTSVPEVIAAVVVTVVDYFFLALPGILALFDHLISVNKSIVQFWKSNLTDCW